MALQHRPDAILLDLDLPDISAERLSSDFSKARRRGTFP